MSNRRSRSASPFGWFTRVSRSTVRGISKLGDPSSPTFLQEVSLLHHDELHYPMVVHTSGYWDYYEDRVVELTALLGANQISIEHRYFGESRPVPTDWSKLTIEQMAADQHAIVTALKQVYEGKFITNGGSEMSSFPATTSGHDITE